MGTSAHNLTRAHHACRNVNCLYPSRVEVYTRSDMAECKDRFKDLYLNNFILAQKRVAHQRLDRLELNKNQRALFARGVAPMMDVKDDQNGVVQACISYAGAIGVMAIDSVIMVYFSTSFSSFYPTSNLPSFFSQAYNSRIMKTRHKNSSYWYKDNKHRLHCPQDGHPQDNLTTSTYCLFNYWILKGHVKLLNSPLCHQLVDKLMLRNHVLDLSKENEFQPKAVKVALLTRWR